MLDLDLIRVVESALVDAFESAPPSASEPREIRRMCKRAAQDLYFRLNGRELLDLALRKLQAEDGDSARYSQAHGAP